MISVVMAYYNRKQHLINTLWSMMKSTYKNFEVIVVDDASDDNNRIEDLTSQFDFLKIIRIDNKDKNHYNPCIPMNIAMGYTKGDVIMIQNPECFHYDDIFQHANNNISKNTYLAYSTINKNIVNVLKEINWNNNYFSEINRLVGDDIKNGVWYCHSKFRPKALNFCTVIMRSDLIDLNGFDERYAFGVACDDDEFLIRIKRKKMNIVIVDDILTIHQSHNPFCYIQKNAGILRNINGALLAKTETETIIKANSNKTIIK